MEEQEDPAKSPEEAREEARPQWKMQREVGVMEGGTADGGPGSIQAMPRSCPLLTHSAAPLLFHPWLNAPNPGPLSAPSLGLCRASLMGFPAQGGPKGALQSLTTSFLPPSLRQKWLRAGQPRRYWLRSVRRRGCIFCNQQQPPSVPTVAVSMPAGVPGEVLISSPPSSPAPHRVKRIRFGK